MRWLILIILSLFVAHWQPSAAAQRAYGSADQVCMFHFQGSGSLTQSRLNNLLKEVTTSAVVSSSNPSNVNDSCRAALALETNGYYALSEEAWLSSIKRFPHDALPYAGILNFYQRSGSRSKFFKIINKCAEEFPDDVVFLMARLQDLNQRKQWAKSFELAKRFVAKPVSDDSAIVFEVVALLGNNQKDKALELSRLLETREKTKNPQKYGISRSIYALCQLSLDRPLEAEKICWEVLSRNSNSEIAALVLTQSLVQRDKRHEALAFIRNYFSHPHYSRALAGAYCSLLEESGLKEELALVRLSILFHDHLEAERNAALVGPNLRTNPHSAGSDMKLFKESIEGARRADRKSFMAVLVHVEPSRFSDLVYKRHALFGGAKAMSVIHLMLADCYRQIGRSDVSRLHLLKAMETTSDYQSSKQIALYLDDEACELERAANAYSILSARFPRAKKDTLVQRRFSQLKRVHNDPSLAQKYTIKRFIYQCYLKELLSTRSERSESLRRCIESLSKDLSHNPSSLL